MGLRGPSSSRLSSPLSAESSRASQSKSPSRGPTCFCSSPQRRGELEPRNPLVPPFLDPNGFFLFFPLLPLTTGQAPSIVPSARRGFQLWSAPVTSSNPCMRRGACGLKSRPSARGQGVLERGCRLMWSLLCRAGLIWTGGIRLFLWEPLRRCSAYCGSIFQNLQTFDPFADATKGDDRLPAGTEDYIHIRIQQRNGRKTLTTVQGIAADYDKKKLVKAFKKKFACNGTVIEHPEYGEVIQLQGDQRKNICQFLIEIDLAKEEQLKVHGF
uniref:Eukaryotic translation initiation factor 1 n=1 Tax=Oryzias latipes TaxID=8090 RepID=A0A3P9KYC1_ORYLA